LLRFANPQLTAILRCVTLEIKGHVYPYTCVSHQANNMQGTVSPAHLQEQMPDYVAHLQIHMALQARNLLPSMTINSMDHRSQLLHKTQADFEKLISRQQ
jgi:hypothetical protein